METFIEFISEQYILVGAWLTLLFLYLKNESMRGGKPVAVQQLSNLVNNDGGVVVDIRDHSEFSKGHIVNAVNIPQRDLEKRKVELNDHKDKPVIVVCKMGHTAGAVSKQLKSAGFTQVYKLTGGLNEWTAASLPLVKA